MAVECIDRDAAYVLDDLLYNESDLTLEGHYTDTHGYTEINFAAFVILLGILVGIGFESFLFLVFPLFFSLCRYLS
jgi:TnpA family transposase